MKAEQRGSVSFGVPVDPYRPRNRRLLGIGGNAERANLQLVHAICDTLDQIYPAKAPHKDLITFVTDRPAHDFRYAIDASKIERELGWQPAHTFESGIRETVAWYLNNIAWAEAVTGKIIS